MFIYAKIGNSKFVEMHGTLPDKCFLSVVTKKSNVLLEELKLELMGVFQH